MFDYRCPECGRGTVLGTEKQNYQIRVDGVEFYIPKAVIGICDSCEAINYDGKEMHRWEQVYKQWQTKSERYVSPQQIKEIRKSLLLNQNEFADYIGVSRQSLAAWENEKRAQVQPNNVDIILRILYDEIGRISRPVSQKMFAEYYRRTGKAAPAQEQVVSENKEEILSRILPITTYTIIREKAQKNNSSIFTEIVRLCETCKQTDTYVNSIWGTGEKSETMTILMNNDKFSPSFSYNLKKKDDPKYAYSKN
ncbi:helix-turn-helix domain-containing protein [bacterium]|nr:helix-turn-helix domain-containing protein [bacterium]MBU1065419.1 helix-turn-helix domain-containing protein [bacterium]MBU1633525.1 helix-turn-helix domain-containing protein [bacterium]MBU1874987.1 helix-turn-helix domain-containing protein [bacterium]